MSYVTSYVRYRTYDVEYDIVRPKYDVVGASYDIVCLLTISYLARIQMYQWTKLPHGLGLRLPHGLPHVTAYCHMDYALHRLLVLGPAGAAALAPSPARTTRALFPPCQ